ncbi:MAG: HAMP domain-containing protein [Gemmatimonadales bacterium]
MALSRLRLRLAAGFAIAFALGLCVLAGGVLGFLWRESTNRLQTRLGAVAEGVASGLARELNDTPDSSLAFAANEVVNEWPVNEDAFAIVSEQGLLVAGVNRGGALDPVLGAWSRKGRPSRTVVEYRDQDFRVVSIPAAAFHAKGHEWRFGIVAFGSTEGIERDTEMLGGALAVAAPLIALLSLAAGYLLARRALTPVDALTGSIASIAPDDLSQRIAVPVPRDEIGVLAVEFNALLERLDEAQRRNRGFVRETAHQLRTPLTLVLGEAAHELATSDSTAERMRATLGRIRAAAEQMRRRVDELFLLAEAQAGERVRLDDDVELDGLVLECSDLVRARASALGRSLAIGRAEQIVVRGNEGLLKEALLELLENSCRHGTSDAAVTVSSYLEDGNGVVAVESAGPPFSLPAANERTAPEGLGLAIVQWIALAHAGQLRLTREGGLNVAALVLPVTGAAQLARKAP